MQLARRTHLIEIEDQIELTDIVEVLVEHLDEVVYRLQVGQVIVVHVDTDAEVQASVSSVDDLKVAKLCGQEKAINKEIIVRSLASIC